MPGAHTCSQFDGRTGTAKSSSSSSAHEVMLILGCEKIAFSSSALETAFLSFLRLCSSLPAFLDFDFLASESAEKALLVARDMDSGRVADGTRVRSQAAACGKTAVNGENCGW